ncbi:hypothetical protein E2C00_16705 [Streptomyces sp. WAC05374]|uniref:hypothetical protein n=1 Tax=Streptomyces sp. WAC05374 TaxID=2487420 RepID=UPI000F873B48|nr:hypothetical protein [Streptomyces sp. WAC05374]RST13005.1 hypothetical protein EF905_21285 [Streptomyces sp. WAC05374]TDF54566.1 hypothetical protein E2C00_16705 [Streptomyces sp. WAC05374]TDF56201.1 hypothetical protein E2C02_12160 [Streptomyces sp. WAC05374]
MQTWEAALERLCAVHVPEDESAELPDDLFDAVDQLIAAYGADDIAEIIAQAVRSGRITVRQATTCLGVAQWSGTDNGAALRRTLDDWVRRADDTARLHMALHQGMWLLPTATEMHAKLTEIAVRYPEHQAVCRYLISTRPAHAQP